MFVIITLGVLTQGTFGAGTVMAKDTVFVTPAKPTTRDSLQFSLRNFEHCCATKYLDKTVSVSNDTIILSYGYNDSLCPYVDCLLGWSETDFSCPPIKAGRYAIYKIKTMYCLPVPCPGPISPPIFVGTVTVTTPSAISGTDVGPAAVRNELAVAGTSVMATFAKSGPAAIRVFDVRGALLGDVYSGWMPAGTESFSLGPVFAKAHARGTVFVRLTCGGTSATAKTVALGR